MKYELSANDIKKIEQRKNILLPSDAEIKAAWKKAHHGKEAGWGMGKRDHVVQMLKGNAEYLLGLGQGRVDAANGETYATKKEVNEMAPNASAFNLGYYRGYVDYESNRRGWDQPTRDAFDTKYVRR